MFTIPVSMQYNVTADPTAALLSTDDNGNGSDANQQQNTASTVSDEPKEPDETSADTDNADSALQSSIISSCVAAN